MQANLGLHQQESAICVDENPSAYPNSHLAHNAHWGGGVIRLVQIVNAIYLQTPYFNISYV